MKQPKVFAPDIPPPAPPLPAGPRYRYFSTPPTTVTVKLGDFAGQIPDASRTALFDGSREVELPANSVLKGPVPKISLSELAEIVPDSLKKGVKHVLLNLPVSRLAVAYKFIQEQELIEDKPLPPLEPLISPEGSFIPEGFEGDFAPRAIPAETVDTPPDSFAPPVPEIATPAAAVPSGSPGIPPVASPSSEPAKPQGKKIFSILPMFRRKEAAETPEAAPVPPPAPEPAATTEARPRVEIPKPRTTLPPITARVAESIPVPPTTPVPPPPYEEAAVEIEAESYEEPYQPVQAETPEFQTPEFSPQPSVVPAPAKWVEAEHLPKSQPSQEISEQEGLQAVFLTEEYLSVERVIELSGGLPGIKSCVLSQGRAVVAAHNVPDSIDLVSLSSNAVEMLHSMRQSAAKMGVGAIPAVTIHSDKGPITFFHQEDICLLVMHKDRGFVPGVREKLQAVVRELSRANLTLPANPARPSLGE